MGKGKRGRESFSAIQVRCPSYRRPKKTPDPFSRATDALNDDPSEPAVDASSVSWPIGEVSEVCHTAVASWNFELQTVWFELADRCT